MLPRTLELEASLRSLISDADAAGRHLNEQLLRREQNLQKLLADISEAEGRLSRSITASEERSKEIHIALENAQELIAELKESFKEEQEALRRQQQELRTHQRSFKDQDVKAESLKQTSRKRLDEPQPPSFEEVGYHRARPRASAPAEYDREISPQPERMSEDQRRSRPAVSSQEKVMQPEPREPARKPATYQAEAATEQRNMQKIYAAAEVLLKQGRQLEQVSAQTRLPVEEVRMLSQMIEIERDEEQRKSTTGAAAPVDDSRLGVLGNIRRQTTTI
jgi:DNA repair exonuclease SbcCD ATPase subunit